MKKMLKLFSFLIVGMLVFLGIAMKPNSLVHASAENLIRVGNVEELATTSSANFNYTIKLLEGSDVSSFQTRLVYDPGLVTVHGYDDHGNDLVVNTMEDGFVQFNFSTINRARLLQANDEILTIHFQVNEWINKGRYQIVFLDDNYSTHFAYLSDQNKLVPLDEVSFEFAETIVGQLGDVDLDGEITIFDATTIQLYLADYEELSPEQLANADVDFDGEVSILDATVIRLVVAGLRDGFVETTYFTVRFYGYYGELLSEQVVRAGDSAYAPDPNVPEGHQFLYWSLDFYNIQEDLEVHGFYTLEQEYYSIHELTYLPIDTEVKIEGKIYYLVHLNETEYQGFYIQDTYGDVIYCYGNPNVGSVKTGDSVTVQGTYTRYFLQPELTDINITNYQPTEEPIEYNTYEDDLGNISQFSSEEFYNYGFTAFVYGTITTDGAYYYLVDDYGHRIELKMGSTYTNVDGVSQENFKNQVGITDYYQVILSDYDFTRGIWRAYVTTSKHQEQYHTLTYLDSNFNPWNYEDVDHMGFATMDEFPVVDFVDFVGWYRDPDLTQPFDKEQPITSSLTLYPKYKAYEDYEYMVFQTWDMPENIEIRFRGIITTFTYKPGTTKIDGLYLVDDNGHLMYLYGEYDYSEYSVGDQLLVQGQYTMFNTMPEIVGFEVLVHIPDYVIFDFSLVEESTILDVIMDDEFDRSNMGRIMKLTGFVDYVNDTYYLRDKTGMQLELRLGSEYTLVDGEYVEDFKQYVGYYGTYVVVVSDYFTANYTWRAYVIPNTFELINEAVYQVEAGFYAFIDGEEVWVSAGCLTLPEVNEGVYAMYGLYVPVGAYLFRFVVYDGFGNYVYYPSTGPISLDEYAVNGMIFGSFVFYEEESPLADERFDYRGIFIDSSVLFGYYSYLDEAGDQYTIQITFGDSAMYINGEYAYDLEIRFSADNSMMIYGPDGWDAATFDSNLMTLTYQGNVYESVVYLTDSDGKFILTPIYEVYYRSYRRVGVMGVVVGVTEEYFIVDDNTGKLLVQRGDVEVAVGDVVQIVGDITEDIIYCQMTQVYYFEVVETNENFEQVPIYFDYKMLTDHLYYGSMLELPLVRTFGTVEHFEGELYIVLDTHPRTRLKIVSNGLDLTHTIGREVDFNAYFLNRISEDDLLIYLVAVDLKLPGPDLIGVTQMFYNPIDISIEWVPIENAVNYIVDVNGVKMSTTSTLFYLHEFVGKEAFVSIRAVYADGMSRYSAPFVVVIPHNTILKLWQIDDLGQPLYEHYQNGTSIPGTYFSRGKIIEIKNYLSGNMYVMDEFGNVLYLHGVSNADGLSYGNMVNPPKVGDTIVFEGTIAFQDGIIMKDNVLRSPIN